MNIEISGDYLPEQPDTELWRKWQKILTREQAHVYQTLVDLCYDGISDIDDARLASMMGVSKNRLFNTILPALQAVGLVSIPEIV